MPYNRSRRTNSPATSDAPTGQIHHHFNSGQQFAQWFTAQRTTNGVLRTYDGYSPRSDEGHNALTHGSEKNLNSAQAMIDELTLEVPAPRRTWAHDVQGAFIDAGRLTTGQPDMMYNQQYAPSDRSPLHIYVGITSQWDIDESLLVRRGAALAAFSIAMTNIRPVIITPYVELASWGRPQRMALLSWDISTSPLVLGELMIISQPEVTRYFGIEACRQVFGPVLEDEDAFHPDTHNEQKMRKHLNISDGDLYLPSIRTFDPMLQNPVEWINNKVTHYASGETDDLITPYTIAESER